MSRETELVNALASIARELVAVGLGAVSLKRLAKHMLTLKGERDKYRSQNE